MCLKLDGRKNQVWVDLRIWCIYTDLHYEQLLALNRYPNADLCQYSRTISYRLSIDPLPFHRPGHRILIIHIRISFLCSDMSVVSLKIELRINFMYLRQCEGDVGLQKTYCITSSQHIHYWIGAIIIVIVVIRLPSSQRIQQQ